MMEKISIIVPVYNVSQYIHKCIDSIINQTYSNLEIILIDDGSTDNCGVICDEYAKKDDRIKVIHKKNEGVSAARNSGIDVATGEYLGFVDSDDWIDENMYKLLYTNLKKEDADISCCNRYLVYSNNMKIYGKQNFYEVMNSERAMELLCTIGYIGFSVYTKLFKKELFKNVRFPIGKINEETFISYKVFSKANKIVYDATPIYYYRQRKGSLTNREKINLDAIEASKELMNFIEKNYPNITSAAAENYIYSSIGVYDNILKRKNKTKEMLKLKKEIKQEVNKYYSLIKNKKDSLAQRKLQLFLIRYLCPIYNISFILYDTIKGIKRKKE